MIGINDRVIDNDFEAMAHVMGQATQNQHGLTDELCGL